MGRELRTLGSPHPPVRYDRMGEGQGVRALGSPRPPVGYDRMGEGQGVRAVSSFLLPLRPRVARALLFVAAPLAIAGPRPLALGLGQKSAAQPWPGPAVVWNRGDDPGH